MEKITIKDAIYSSLSTYVQVIRDFTADEGNEDDPYGDERENMKAIADMIEKELQKKKYKDCTFFTV